MIQPPPSVLEAARMLSGRTQAELATAVGVTQSSISQFEHGVGITEPDLAAAVAVELDIPALLLGVQPPAPQIMHQLPASLPQKPANRTLASVTLAHARVALLLGAPTMDLRRSPGGIAWEHPHGYAERVRKDWGLPAGPISELVPTLESHGIVCVYRDLSALRTHALTSTSEDGVVLMLLDSGATRRDLAWAVAHELGHLMFGDEPSKTGESDADEFAVEFLALGRELLDLTITTSEGLVNVATTFGVPPRALLKRLRQLGGVSARGQRDIVSGLAALPATELSKRFIGSPGLLATAVRTMGGSTVAARQAFLTVEELRADYLSRSGA